MHELDTMPSSELTYWMAFFSNRNKEAERREKEEQLAKAEAAKWNMMMSGDK